MNASRADAVRALLHDIAAAEDSDELSSWGELEAEGALGGRTLVRPRPETPFESFEFRPWTDGRDGLVDVELREPWAVDEVIRELGPFNESPVLESGATSVTRMWDDPALPAGTLLIVWLAGDSVPNLTIRRDPRG